MASRPVRKAEAAEVRRIFNALRLWDLVQQGKVLASPASSHPADARYGEPEGTLSQMVHYFRLPDLERIAIVHQLLRPDGTIGASGQPDPKRLMLDDEILFC